MRGLFFVYFRCLFFAKEFDPAHKNPEKRSQKSLYLKEKSKISFKRNQSPFPKEKRKEIPKVGGGCGGPRSGPVRMVGSNRQDKTKRRKKDKRE